MKLYIYVLQKSWTNNNHHVSNLCHCLSMVPKKTMRSFVTSMFHFFSFSYYALRYILFNRKMEHAKLFLIHTGSVLLAWKCVFYYVHFLSVRRIKCLTHLFGFNIENKTLVPRYSYPKYVPVHIEYWSFWMRKTQKSLGLLQHFRGLDFRFGNEEIIWTPTG